MKTTAGLFDTIIFLGLTHFLPNGCIASYSPDLGFVRVPTYQDFLDVKELVLEYIDMSDCRGEESTFWNDTIGDCDYFPAERNPKGFGSRLVRHAFHDATGYSDGFVDLTNAENNGLQHSKALVDMMYDNPANVLHSTEPAVSISSVITKADFYAWAYITGVLWSRDQIPKNTYMPEFRITYGRITWEDDEIYPTEYFPNEFNGAAKATGAQIMTYFADKFGFDERETATILGAHTFGGARTKTSGFAGMWTEMKNKFTNEFYENIVEPVTRGLNDAGGYVCSGMKISEQSDDWKSACCDQGSGNRCMGWELSRVAADPNGVRNFQWRHSCDDFDIGCTMIMLHVDMALYRDIDAYINDDGSITEFPVDAPHYCVDGGRVYATCFEKRTDFPSATNAIDEFSLDDNEFTFVDEFVVVFTKMIETVNDEYVTLTELHEETFTPTSTPTSTPTTKPLVLVKNKKTCPCEYDESYGKKKTACDLCKSGKCKRKLKPNKGIDLWRCVK